MGLNRLARASSGEGTVEPGMLSWAGAWMNKLSLRRSGQKKRRNCSALASVAESRNCTGSGR